MSRLRISTLLCFFIAYVFTVEMDNTVNAAVPNVCLFPGVPMYCNCDETDPDEATYVSCFVSQNITIDDPHWEGFQKQKNIKSLVFNPRLDTFLTYVPHKVLRTLHQMEHVLFSEAHIRVLTSMSFSNLTAVRSINVESNQIEEIEPRAFAYLPALRKLELSDNKLTRLTAEIFEDVPKLETLYLENNRLTFIDDGAFSMLPSLQELDLFHNEITHVRPQTFVGLDSLFRLDLSRNNITHLVAHVFKGTPNLQDLELGQNQIRTISNKAFAGLPYLLNLRMKDNFLTVLPENVFQGSPNILSLRLADNLLTKFPKTILLSLNNRTNSGFAVYIKGNPLHCSCELDWVMDYSKASKNIIFREDLKSLECVTSEKSKMNLISYITKRDCSINGAKGPGDVNQKISTTEANVLNDPVSDDDYDEDDDDDENDDDDQDNDRDVDHDNNQDDDDQDNDKYDDDQDNDRDVDHDVDHHNNRAGDRDLDHDVDHDMDHDVDKDNDNDDDYDTEDHSVNVDDIPDVYDENDYSNNYARRRPITQTTTTEAPKNLLGDKKQVSLTSKSQPSAADSEETANVNKVQSSDPNSSTALISSTSSIVFVLFSAFINNP